MVFFTLIGIVTVFGLAMIGVVTLWTIVDTVLSPKF